MIPYFFVLLMMAIGGVIGFLADSWGHKIGKKRLSFMGLRPRHTATLITVGAGVLIPLLTVVIVAMLSSGVRDWLLRGQKALDDALRLEHQVTQLQAEQTDVEARIRDKTALSERLDRELKAGRAQVAALEKKLAENRNEAAAAAAKAARLTSRLDGIRAQLTEMKRALASAKGDLAKRQAQYHSLDQSYNVLVKDRDEAYKEYDRQQKEIAKLEDQIKGLNAGIADAQARKEQAENDLKGAKEDLARTAAKMQATVDDFQKRIAENAKELSDSQSQLSSVRSLVNLELKSIGDLRSQPIIFSRGEELARVPIAAGGSAAQASATLEAVLRAARLEAERRGAKATKDGPAAGLFPRRTDTGTVSVADQEIQWTTELAGRSVNRVLIAHAAFNTFSGEWVPLILEAKDNPMVYGTGHVIAETVVDGRKPEDQIFAAVTDFLRQKVSDRATKDGMIPAEGRDYGLGEVPASDLLALMHQIGEQGQRVRIRAEAAQDTRAADPLKLKLTVR